MYFNKTKKKKNRSNLSVKFVPYQRFDTAAKPHTRQATNTHPIKKENNTLTQNNTRRCKTHTHTLSRTIVFCMNLCETRANDKAHERAREKRKVNQIEL